MAYIEQDDVENALGLSLVKSIFDDDNDGLVDEAPMAACIAYACGQVDAFLAGTYDITLPIASPPDVVKFAAVDYACAYAARRRPEILRVINERSWKDYRDAAIENMKMFAMSLQRLPEAIAPPKNVGGLITDDTDRITSADVDGDSRMGDF